MKLTAREMSAIRTLPRPLKYGTHEGGPSEAEQEKMVKCSYCSGTGQVESQEHVTREMALGADDETLEGAPIALKDACPTCHGTGLVSDDDPAEPEPEFDTTEERRER